MSTNNIKTVRAMFLKYMYACHSYGKYCFKDPVFAKVLYSNRPDKRDIQNRKNSLGYLTL